MKGYYIEAQCLLIIISLVWTNNSMDIGITTSTWKRLIWNESLEACTFPFFSNENRKRTLLNLKKDLYFFLSSIKHINCKTYSRSNVSSIWFRHDSLQIADDKSTHWTVSQLTTTLAGHKQTRIPRRRRRCSSRH